MKKTLGIIGILVATFCGWWMGAGLDRMAVNAALSAKPAEANVDWAQWGGDSMRNNTPVGYDIPTEWEVGDFDYRTGEWDSSEAKKHQVGRPTRLANLRQRRGLRRQGFCRHQQ